MHSDLPEFAVGRWYGILSTLGVSDKYLRNKHGPCPLCDDGKDRYRWDNREGRGTFICNKCGAGDGFELLQRLKGWDFKRTAEEVEAVVGNVRRVEPRSAPTSEEQREAMQKRWKQCKAVMPEDATSKYLTRRIGISHVPAVLRSAPDRPAMVAIMQAPDGRATMIHTTFLTASGEKAPMDNPRLMMPGTIAEGAAVRLAEHGDEIGIAEGIETALSATALTGIPCWAALNRVLLMKWIAPTDIKRVVIFGDNDAKFDGQAAAYALASKIGRQKDAPAVEVRIPATIGEDWNDVLLHRQPACT